MKVYNIGIIGCGTIAARMAKTLNGMKGLCCSLQKSGQGEGFRTGMALPESIREL